jgi:hypothetical protein
MLPIATIAGKLGLPADYVVPYGEQSAKVKLDLLTDPAFRPTGKFILVTAITPTSAGEGKTVVSISLTQGLERIGKRVVATLREPSLGPVFGIKGGATGPRFCRRRGSTSTSTATFTPLPPPTICWRPPSTGTFIRATGSASMSTASPGPEPWI